MNIHEIYNLLLEGETLELDFSTKQESEIFRVRLAQFKASKDKMMIGIGFMEEEAKQKLSFSIKPKQPDLLDNEGMKDLLGEAPLLGFTAIVSFKDKLVLRQYSVKVLKKDSGD